MNGLNFGPNQSIIISGQCSSIPNQSSIVPNHGIVIRSQAIVIPAQAGIQMEMNLPGSGPIIWRLPSAGTISGDFL
jgi:hypothetical protein